MVCAYVFFVCFGVALIYVDGLLVIVTGFAKQFLSVTSLPFLMQFELLQCLQIKAVEVVSAILNTKDCRDQEN